MNFYRGRLEFEVVNGKIFVIGGFNGYIEFNIVEIYDGIINSWSFVLVMLQCRSSFGIGVIDGYIYVVGGY